jgi:Zn finger protein HypA/HybF involved in hydrogenase expression
MNRYNSGEPVNWFVVALAAVAVAGAVVVFYFVFRGDPEAQSAAAERANRPMKFKCDKCGHQFSLPPKEFHKQWKDVSNFTREQAGKANCPTCGGTYCASQVDDPHRGQKPGVLPPPEAPEGG